MVRDKRLGPHAAARYIATQFLTARAEVLNFAAVFRRTVKGHLGDLFVADGNAETRAKLAELFLIELLLLVSDVPALAAFTKTIALDRAREDDSWRTPVFDRRLVSSVYFARIVAALS